MHSVISCLVCFLFMANVYAQKQRYFLANQRKVDIAFFDDEVQKMMNDIGVPGASIAIIDNNEISYFKSYGYKSLIMKDRVNNETIFEGCSLSKTFLVFVVYQLVDQGKLDLDKPMYQYLEYEYLSHDDRYKRITPRMVLSHCSGLENWKYDNDNSVLEIMFTPGERFLYSGEGYQYLAEVVRTIINKSYVDYTNEMVISALGLKRTFMQYSADERYPENYATGHNDIGTENKKWKHTYAIPAAGNEFTAEDYAKLIIGIVNGKRLSKRSRQAIVQPVTKLKIESNSSVYYGPGFEVIYTGKDTIIAHGGDNGGFKAQVFYSMVNKCGLVVMTNSDRGAIMPARLNDLSVKLDTRLYYRFKPEDDYKWDFYDQYPSNAVRVMKIYREAGTDAMFAELKKLRGSNALSSNTLCELGSIFIYRDARIAKHVLEEAIEMFPDASVAYFLYGKLNTKICNFEVAEANLHKAAELGYSPAEIAKSTKDIDLGRQEISQRQQLFTIIKSDSATVLQAENYNVISGMGIDETDDQGGGENLCCIEPGEWTNYRVHVKAAGKYKVSFRVSSHRGGGKLDLLSESSMLGAIEIPATGGPQKWITVATQVHLSQGEQILKIYAPKGIFGLNWVRFDLLN